MTFAREAFPFVLPPLVLSALLAVSGAFAWSVGAALVTLAVLAFFRIPARPVGSHSDAVLSPANGRVLRVDRVAEPTLGPGEHQRIVTFLSVFDVHVQRAPVSGEVVASRRTEGRKLAAFRAAAGEVNERHLTVLRKANGELFGVRQIAGLVARRVVCYAGEGSLLERGELLGIIKFGSRVDLLLPAGYQVTVEPGQRLREGLTEVARPVEAR